MKLPTDSEDAEIPELTDRAAQAVQEIQKMYKAKGMFRPLAAAVALLTIGRLAVSQTIVKPEERLFRSEVSVMGDALLTKASDGNGVFQRNTKAGGVLGAYRYRFNGWLSAESAYGWNRDSHLFYTPAGFGRVQSDVHQATAGLVIALPVPRSLRIPGVTPSFLVEGGALVYAPTNAPNASIPGAQIQTIGTFVYGGSMDIQVPGTKRFVFRLDNRTLVHSAPSFGIKALDTHSVVLSNEFMAGAAFRF